ncbi:GNAT family N-acetyltransferase [Streptomyces sp. P9-A4]|uniref:GNAT family N-acetyltransferase n=1 Tax=Streptomyces sp. P9-A4 TaxID=3072285 RepID=UPI002FC99F23
MNDEDPLLGRARRLWEALAAAPVSFAPSGGVSVVVSPESGLCPPSWVGVVMLGNAAIVTAPTEAAARAWKRGTAGAPVESLVSAEAVRGMVHMTDALGPATLAYASPEDFRPWTAGAVGPAGAVVEEVRAGSEELRALVGSVGREDADESGIQEITSPAFVVRGEGGGGNGGAGADGASGGNGGAAVIAAAGYRTWPESTAHISVLTAPGHRGRGLARRTASAAVARALEAGLMPQWRARTVESRAVARALGFRELGMQLSVRLDEF